MFRDADALWIGCLGSLGRSRDSRLEDKLGTILELKGSDIGPASSIFLDSACCHGEYILENFNYQCLLTLEHWQRPGHFVVASVTILALKHCWCYYRDFRKAETYL